MMLRYLYILVFLIFPAVYSACQLNDAPEEGSMAGQPVVSGKQSAGGLLFHLSGNKSFEADFAAGGQVKPNYLKDVSLITSGASGRAFRAEDSQLMTYWAPGNIFAQRGTLSFFWRSRYPAGKTPFPVFRVGYADHSSWDMVWLRIDYNGSGFDAFVTDIGLARTRISYFMDQFPGPEEWIHLALSWEESEGIRFYVNGELAARQSVSGTVYDAGLDQLGPHSRIISPYQVQSAYNFMRGGDIDEIRIYDRMLPDEAVSMLARGKEPGKMQPFVRDLSLKKWRDAWWLRNGWNLPNPPPPVLPSKETIIRKAEISDAYDIKRWYWKANDGIRETTWPGVYNMSRLPGRYDYFVLPDWDCYSGSGQTVRFSMPEEKWNHIEIYGKAWGQLTLEKGDGRENTFAVRTRNQVKSIHNTGEAHTGGTIRFDKALIEEPIGSFDAYNVSEGKAPEASDREVFTLVPEILSVSTSSIDAIRSFVAGRYPSDERAIMLAMSEGESLQGKRSAARSSLPFVHVIIPNGRPDEGLDGIEISFQSLNVSPTHGDFFPMNIRIKDPLWAMRDMADFSFSVKRGDAPVLWFDTRDRIMPVNRALYLTIAGAGADLTPEMLKGTRIRLIYKPKQSALKEHEADRFTQVRDLYGHIVEEHPRTSRLNLFNRFMADCNDLLKVNPDHKPGQAYQYAATGMSKPAFEIPRCPDGIPEWAFLQTEYLRHLERLADFYIDKRQISNGEFGGGLSDDGDLTNMWPGIAFLGINPEKMLESLRLHITAYYDQERPARDAPLKQRSLPLFTNGLATITTDELHALEEGIQVVAQLQLLDHGNPLFMEKGMETTLRLLEDVTGINEAGHRHFRSRLYGGTKISADDPWQWSVNRSYLVLHPAYLVARYNGSPLARKLIVELAEGLLAHRRNGNLFTDINFATDADREDTGMATGSKPWALLYAAYRLTGDKKFLEPLPRAVPGKGIFDINRIASRYREEITNLSLNEYINTEGSLWIDRISSFNPVIQEDRLGGVALTRTNMLYPQHYVSWKFVAPSKFDDVAIFVASPSDSKIEIIAYNLHDEPVSALMTLWDVKPGKWKIRSGTDKNDDREIDTGEKVALTDIEPGTELPVSFASKGYHIIQLELVDEVSFSGLPDLALADGDVKKDDKSFTVRIHNIGSAASSPSVVELRDEHGKIVAEADVPGIDAPSDLEPKWKEITFDFPADDLRHAIIQIDPENNIHEITERNNTLQINLLNTMPWNH